MEILMTVRKIASICTMVSHVFILYVRCSRIASYRLTSVVLVEVVSFHCACSKVEASYLY